MGRFEVDEGRITAWYDYFDTALVGKLFAGESVDDLVP
jgi:limonene-1,2-epoxide hydrolase